jgi:hypothetical protein
MAESPRRVDLRLTIPAAAPYRELAVELAVKFAEYAGASKAAAADVSKTVAAAVGAAPHGHPAVDLRFSADDGDVTVTVDASPD